MAARGDVDGAVNLLDGLRTSYSSNGALAAVAQRLLLLDAGRVSMSPIRGTPFKPRRPTRTSQPTAPSLNDTPASSRVGFLSDLIASRTKVLGSRCPHAGDLLSDSRTYARPRPKHIGRGKRVVTRTANVGAGEVSMSRLQPCRRSPCTSPQAASAPANVSQLSTW